jgi:carbon-monoxide dehydrogenase catalytic subunit
VLYEKAIADIADILLKNDIIVLTNGCASFPLLKQGFCRIAAAEQAGNGLRTFLGGKLPPVWHMGECIDNARASTLFKAVAAAAGEDLKNMPFAFASPEWSNEKGIGAALSFRLMGVSSYHCVYPPVQGSKNVMNYVLDGGLERFGSRMVVDTAPLTLAEKIVSDLKEKRTKLGW